MEDIEFDPFNFVHNYPSILVNPAIVRDEELYPDAEVSEYYPPSDVVAAELPTESVEGADVSQETPELNIDPEPEIGDQGPKSGRRELSNEDKLLAYEMLLQKSVDGKLKKTSTQEVASLFNVKIRSIQRLWRRGKDSGNHNGSLNRVKNCGRKRIEWDIQRIREIPLRRRSTLRSLACALGVSKTFLISKLKCGELRRYTNHIKPLLTEGNCLQRIRHCLSMLDPGAPPTAPTFSEMENVVHIDGKWFQLSKKKQTYYLLPDEDEHVRTCKSTNFIPKIMFLASVARPRYDPDGNCTFDGRISVFPLVSEVAGIRYSANRVAGTLELKPILKIDRKVIRKYMIDYVLPAIKEKWPRDSIMDPIIIQQDNAKIHIHENDIDFSDAVDHVGLDIRLLCQPPNSSDLNMLDLGFFRAIKSLQEKECARNVSYLVEAVKKSFFEFSHQNANNIFITLQSCMIQTQKTLGSNSYRISHMKKAHLARIGLLPSTMSCDPSVIAIAAAHLSQ